MLITATGQTVWVILTEGCRIRLTGVIVPCAPREITSWTWDPKCIKKITILGLWIILLTVGVRVLLTGEKIFPGTIRLSNVVPRVNIIAARNAFIEPDYHPQVCQVVHGGKQDPKEDYWSSHLHQLPGRQSGHG